MDGWTGNLPVMCYSREDESFRLLTCLGLPFIDFFFSISSDIVLRIARDAIASTCYVCDGNALSIAQPCMSARSDGSC